MRLFSTAVAGQVVLSGTNFLVGFILIRFTSDRDYGMYVLVTSSLLLLTSAQNAWLVGPLAVLVPRMSADERRGVLTSVKSWQRHVLQYAAIALLAVPLVGYLLGKFDILVTVVIGCGILAGWAGLRREYLRVVLLIYSRPRGLLAADAIYAAALVISIALALRVGHAVIVGAVLGLALAAWVGAAVAHQLLAADPGWVPGDAAPVWPEIRRLGRWSLVGTIIYWFLGQSYSSLLAARLDLKAVADVNAARLMLMPAFVLSIGVTSLLGPSAAAWYAESGVRALVRRLALFVIGVGALDLFYFSIIWLARNWLMHTVLHKNIADQDRLLVLWGGVAVVGLVRDVLQCALFAMGRMKSMALQLAYSAAAALVVTWFGFAWWGASAVLIGQIFGEVVNLAGILGLLRRSMRTG